MTCFQCGHSLSLASGERVGFRDTCDPCGADLHVCANCAHHEPGAYNECRESSAERVGDRQRANRCDCFVPAGTAGEARSTAPAATRSALDALFKKPG